MTRERHRFPQYRPMAIRMVTSPHPRQTMGRSLRRCAIARAVAEVMGTPTMCPVLSSRVDCTTLLYRGTVWPGPGCAMMLVDQDTRAEEANDMAAHFIAMSG